MTPADEARFIELWTQGVELAATAQRLGIPKGTVSSRATALRKRGVALAKRSQGGAYPAQRVKARQEGTPAPPATPAPPTSERQDIQQWTVRLSKVLIEPIKAVAYEWRMPPSQLLEELAWKALNA
jgi:hypothetical protein